MYIKKCKIITKTRRMHFSDYLKQYDKLYEKLNEDSMINIY